MKKLCWLLLVIMVVVLSGTSVSLSATATDTALKTALEKAKAQGKPLFVQLGRESCSHCQDLKSYIKKGTVNIENFIYVDLDYDNGTVRKQFETLFTVSGDTMPFVVIADSNGKQITSRSGPGTPTEYKVMIDKVKK
ncbi:MAG: thioredoxin family protein [Syntrophales bacterium]